MIVLLVNIKYESGCVYKIKMKILKDEIWKSCEIIIVLHEYVAVRTLKKYNYIIVQ